MYSLRIASRQNIYPTGVRQDDQVLPDDQGAAVLVVTPDHRALPVFDAIYEMEDMACRVSGVGSLQVPSGRVENYEESTLI